MREPIFSRSKMFGRLAFSEPTGKASIWTACPFAATTFSEASTMINPTSNPSSRTSFPPGPGGLRQDPKPHQADLRGPTDTGIPPSLSWTDTSICLLLCRQSSNLKDARSGGVTYLLLGGGSRSATLPARYCLKQWDLSSAAAEYHAFF